MKKEKLKCKENGVSLCQAGVQWRIPAHCNFRFRFQASCLSLPSSWDYRHAPRPANFFTLVETGFHRVGQDGLDLLTS
ncbi:Protein GVQW1 [Plecturocebus cupreus]